MAFRPGPKFFSWSIALGVILFFSVPYFLQDGHFMDGLIYGTISNNLVNGEGSLWAPHFTGDVISPFYGHPPLAFLLEAPFHALFDGYYVPERLYAIFTFICLSLVMAAFWRRLVPKERGVHFWLPIVLWVLTPAVFWNARVNMLENTLSVFTLLAVFLLWKGSDRTAMKRFQWALLAGVCVLAAALTKGMVALFPLGVPFLIWVVLRKGNWQTFLLDSAAMVLGIVGAAGLLMVLMPDMRDGLQAYYDTQLGPSLQGEAYTVGRRTFIMERLFIDLLVMMGLTGLYVLIRRKSVNFAWDRRQVFFVLVGIAASAPIMISPKQHTFYMVPSIPYFALAFALWIERDLGRFKFEKSRKHLMMGLAAIVVGMGVNAGVQKSLDNGEGSLLKHDLAVMREELPGLEELSIIQYLDEHWNVIGEMKRFNGYQVYRGQDLEFMVGVKDRPLPEGYVDLDLPTKFLKVGRRQ